MLNMYTVNTHSGHCCFNNYYKYQQGEICLNIQFKLNFCDFKHCLHRFNLLFDIPQCTTIGFWEGLASPTNITVNGSV